VNKVNNLDSPMYGIVQLSPEELVEQQLKIRESAITKLVGLGLTQEEVMSLISLDISEGG
jgi:DNA-binding CsgD family transcriptional regulator